MLLQMIGRDRSGADESMIIRGVYTIRV